MQKQLEIIQNFITDRPVIEANNSDVNQMAVLLMAEVNEALEVLDDPEKLGGELVDVIWFCLSIALLSGIDIETEFGTKAARNLAKRPASMFQNGDYFELDASARKYWKETNGDKDFYE